MNPFNPAQQAFIAEWSADMKIDIAFAEELCHNVLKHCENKPVEGFKANTGRKMTEEAKQLRNSLESLYNSHHDGRVFTAKDLAVQFSSKPEYASNALSEFEKAGKVVRAGFKERMPGQMGKNVTLWKFVEKE